MINVFSKALCALMCWALLLACQTATAELSFKHYPEARVMFSSRETTSDYVLALGIYKKSEGSWLPERSRRLSGQLQRFTLELPTNHSAEAGFDFYRQQLQQLNRRELFSCRARACGTSNAWANNHFKILQLYGLDQFQQFAVYEVSSETAATYYVTIYSVQRGNRRVYVQLDILQSDKDSAGVIAATPDTLIRLLESRGFYLYPDVIVDTDSGAAQLKLSETHLQTLVSVLQRKPEWKLALVGHDYHAMSLAAQQKASLVYAEQLQQALQAAGIAADRLSVHGLGGLAPAGRGDLSARVEVVLLP